MKRVFLIVVSFALVLFLMMWFFNLTFTLPTSYSEMVERNKKEKGIESEPEQVRVLMKGDVELTVPTENRELLIDHPDQVERLSGEAVQLYAVRDSDRLQDHQTSNHYEVHLLYEDDLFQSYKITDSYIQSMEGEFFTYQVLGEENSLFLYLESLYE